MRFPAVVAIAVALFSVFPAALEARPLAEVLDSKSLKAVVYLDNEPFSWDEDGKTKGIDADLARAIAKELGVECEIIARMQGEKADDDLRVNLWKGPLTGGGTGDIMMHVPVDPEFAERNKQVTIGNPYFQEKVVVAIHPELTGDNPDFNVFKSKKIGVQLGTVADYFLMSYEDGALIENVAHHVKPEAGAKEFAAKEVAAMMGDRAMIESLLGKLGVKPVIVEPPMDGIVRTGWVAGIAWKADSDGLGDAIAKALDRLKTSGELKRIFESYGVSYQAP